MKTNLLTSKLRDFYAFNSKHHIAAALAISFCEILLFFLLLSLVACKSPATLTNTDNHHTRDSNYHATVHRLETHDTIIIGIPYNSPAGRGDKIQYAHKNYPRDCKGNAVLEPFVGGNLLLDYLPLVKISDRTRTIHDTTFILRTDTLLRTQTITQKERYIPPFYRFCTITLITLITLVTLAFSIRLLLRYLKTR